MDDDVVELNNIENLCRLCLSTEDPKSPIFGLQESPVSLVEKIQACLSIEILLTDKLSKLICINCLKSVNQWHNYKESCLKSQEKLQRWLVKQINSSVAVVATIKPEPLDIEVYEDNIEIVEMSEDELHNELSNRSTELPNDNALPELAMRGSRRRLDINLHNNTGKDNNKYINSYNQGLVSDNNDEIKLEPTDDDEDDIDCNVDVESINENDNEGELLLNPMALGASKNMEPDSTQKFNVRAVKKKVRRGPHTHFRGPKVFKRRCPHCQLTLHSKSSYARHINRYHNDAQLPSAVTAVNNSIGGNSQHQQHQVSHNGLPYSKDDDNSAAEEIEDVEDELVSLEKDAPLTQVQESIISQLKTFSCYACQQSFNDRRSTLNHIRQHMPDLRPYTCIACLTEFPDRSIYKLHCGASFECAMKIALVVPKHGTEKYFTCNMCLRPMPNRKELISHLSKHSDRQYEQLTAPSGTGGSKKPPKLKPIGSNSGSANASTSNSNSAAAKSTAAVSTTIGPYRNGDPAHNHTCDYCGMIYRYKPNMVKHQDLCKRLPPEERTSYRCVHCGMTFLVFKKFQSHITTEHNKKELICFVCNGKFRYSNEYLIHHQKHRMINKAAETHALNHWNKTVTMKYGCAVCPEQFDTKAELNDHRSVHLKLKIFSCSICRRMFGNSASLQEHVNEDHALEVDPNISAIDFLDQSTELPNTSSWSVNTDPGVRSTECTICGKVFANYPNLRRHIRSVHAAEERFNCNKCSKTFSNDAELSEHTDSAHAEQVSNRCNYCKKKFDSKHGLDVHQRNAHGITDSKLACDICGKEFGNETSLKIHRGHHFRRDSRLSIRNMPHPMDQVQVEINEAEPEVVISTRPGRARKSLSNTSLSSSPKSSSELKCQVCDDKFTDVHDLRKHLWDVHCAKNKPEKSFIDDNNLQCELCTNLLPDDKSLEEHMKWHKDNPILSDGLQRPVDISCDVCGKFYSSTKALWKHKKLHSKTGVTIKFQSVKKSQPAQYPCPVCRKVFGNETSMKKHKAAAHYARRSVSVVTTTTPKVTSRKSSNDDEVKPKRPKLDFDIIRKAYNLEPNNYNAEVSGGPSNSKKPVSCGICKKLLPSMNSLYKHRQNVHKNFSKSLDNNDDNSARAHNEHDNDDEAVVDKSRVPCTECDKIFSNMSNMKQHLTKVHGNGNKYYCSADGCNQLFNSPLAKQLHEKSHMNVLYRCTICSRHMFLRSAIIQHLVTEHKNDYSPGTEKSLYKKTDLSNYQVHGAEGRVCPICNITYPNIKAMKIHYVKIHENS